jgi:hypothetical protein
MSAPESKAVVRWAWPEPPLLAMTGHWHSCYVEHVLVPALAQGDLVESASALWRNRLMRSGATLAPERHYEAIKPGCRIAPRPYCVLVSESE